MPTDIIADLFNLPSIKFDKVIIHGDSTEISLTETIAQDLPVLVVARYLSEAGTTGKPESEICLSLSLRPIWSWVNIAAIA